MQLLGGRRRIWRSGRSQRIGVQLLFALFAAAVVSWIVARAFTLELDFGFLRSRAGFAIANEWGFTYDSSESRFAAYLVGVWNTLRLVAVGIVLATILGVIAGVARLSGNWIVSRLATLYVETVRNTPLLVQIIFWWLVVFLALPRIGRDVNLLGVIHLSNRALALPWLEPRGLALPWALLLLGALFAAARVRSWRQRLEDRSGAPAYPNRWALGTLLLLATGSFLATGLPLAWTVPEVVTSGASIRRYQGGLEVTPQYAAVLVALVTYTGTFIAEIVRGGIQSLPRGQAEAAAALGLTAYQRMTLVILPQALRTIIPPVTNQYLNLTKNSSLAVAVGYSELFFVSTVIINNAGHAVPMFLLVLVSYQAMSLLISAGMNELNRRVQRVAA